MMDVMKLLGGEYPVFNGVVLLDEDSILENQKQTNDVFSKKWVAYSKEDDTEQEKMFEFQKRWYLDLYGFDSEEALASFLLTKKVILDAGCGLGYKANWFAELSPQTLVLGMDYSDAAFAAAHRYHDVENLIFLKGDIANTQLGDGTVDYVSCDQVIHHTEDVASTYAELTRILASDGEFAVYVYAKKALPRELVDDYFRSATKSIADEAMLEFSSQLTELGRNLSALKVEVDVPDIPVLDIKGGRYDIQRFIYWNFLKCFWNEELGKVTSDATNYDWYAPSNATRYSQQEFLAFAANNNLVTVYLHAEEAAHSGRFRK
jgi:ubiquinone/menaquinone biosynthesis C-methylase UbiE